MSDPSRTIRNVVLASVVFISTLIVAEVSYGSNNLSYAITTTRQQTATRGSQASDINITKFLSTDYPFVTVEYQGNSTVVLKGDEDTLLSLKGSLAPFWQAIDKVKGLGYSLDDLTTSGIGSQGNPTRFYALMSKNTKAQ